MTRWLLTVEAQDRPGIVASVAEALAQAGCNLADVSMTRLSGVFVMLAVVNAPEGLAVNGMWSSGDAVTTWREITDAQSSPQVVSGSRWNVTVYGSDQPGIVAAIAKKLSGLGVNIDDLSTRLINDTYTMLIDATVPDAVNSEALQSELAVIAGQLGVTCHANPVDLDTF